MIEVLVEKHEHKKPDKIKKYIYKCPTCGSIVQFTNEDTEMWGHLGDVYEWLVCPVCNHDITINGRLFHRPKIYKLFHKIK